ncbi:hypothetical protein HK097_006299, partial [Rhizophlyctis rosea]
MDSIPESLHGMRSRGDDPKIPTTSSWVAYLAFTCIIVAITMMLRNVGGTKFEPTGLQRMLLSAEADMSLEPEADEEDETTEVTDPIVDELLTQRENDVFERVQTSDDRTAYWEDLKRRLASVDSKLEDVPGIAFELREAQDSFQNDGRAFIDRLNALTNRIENLLVTNEMLRAEHRQLESRFIFERNALELEFEREFGNAARENETLRTRLAELEGNGIGPVGGHDASPEVKSFTEIMNDMGSQQKDMMEIVSNIGQEIGALDRIGGSELEGLRREVDNLMDENKAYKRRVQELEGLIVNGTGLSRQTADELASEVLDATEDLIAADHLSSSVAFSGLDEEDAEPPALDDVYQRTLNQKNRLEEKNKELEAELDESKKRRDELEPSVTAVHILTQQVSSLTKELELKADGTGQEDMERASPWSDSTQVDDSHPVTEPIAQQPSLITLQTRISSLETALQKARAQRDDCSREILRQTSLKNDARTSLNEANHKLSLASDRVAKVGEIIAWRLIQTIGVARGWGSSTASDTSMKSMDWANVLVRKFAENLKAFSWNDDLVGACVDTFVTELEDRRGELPADEDEERSSNADDVRSDRAVDGGSVKKSFSDVFNDDYREQELEVEVEEISDAVGGDTLVDVTEAPMEVLLPDVATEEERARELLEEVGSEAGVVGGGKRGAGE